jgi:signal transduction histidine kinase
LTSLRHLAELLATDRMTSEDRKQRSYALMLAETDRLGRLVEGLLDFGRLQAGAGSFRFEPVNVPALAREVVSDFSRRLEPEGHQVDLSAESTAATATADREALSRVLWNLLDNAVKYSPDRARVQVAVATDPAGGKLLVSVTDSGWGIPSHEQSQIFDRFVRGADAKARRICGTGIGLSMARDIMRAHNGDITVRSSPGQGSTFTISVPIAPV